MTIDWAEWGPPLAVLALGLVGGWLVLGRTRDDDPTVTDQGRTEDLQTEADAARDALKALESEKHKLSAKDYDRERKALLARGAAALRTLEEGSVSEQIETESIEELRGKLEDLKGEYSQDVWEKATLLAGLGAAPAPVEAAPPPAMGAEWRGALTMLGVVALIGGLLFYANDQSMNRSEGMSMTGNTPGQPSNAAMQASAAHDEAAKQWLEKLKTDPNDLEALNALTWVGLTRSDLQSAQHYNQRAIDAAPKDKLARVYRGVLAALVGMPDRGMEHIDGVLAEDPNHIKALTYKGLMALELGQNEVAITNIEKAISLGGNNPALRSALMRAKGEGPPAMGKGKGKGKRPGPPMGCPPSAATSPGEAVLSGTVRLSPELQGQQHQGVLYVSLRDPRGGPPLAAKKLPPGPFPMAFTITTGDAIAMGGAPRPFPDVMKLAVRIDSDGNAMTKNDGEPAATFDAVDKGTEGLDVLLK